MSQKKVNPIAITVIGLILAYLSILGYAHFSKDKTEIEDVLVSEEERDDLHAKNHKPSRIAKTPRPKPSVQPKVREGLPLAKGQMPELAPRGVSSQEEYDYYVSLAASYGLRVTDMTVIGFRGLDPDGRRHSSDDNATNYDDAFVILDPFKQSARVFLGSTHAGQPSSTLSPNGVAQIDVGRYRAFPSGEFADMPCWFVKTDTGLEQIPCRRDINRNGIIDPDERAKPSFATEILFHNGRYSDVGSSIGCQVIPPDLMTRFIETVGMDSEFDYLLIDANESV